MMRAILIAILILISSSVIGQINYSGYLGKSPISLSISYYDGDGYVSAFYMYDKYDTPIRIDGSLKDKELKLLERESGATLTFQDFNRTDEQIKGYWVNADTSKTYEISLKRIFEASVEDTSWSTIEQLQEASNRKHYFKTIVSKVIPEYSGSHSYTSLSISGVNVYEKGTDKLIQKIDLENSEPSCIMRGFYSVDVDDYNFDGILDFSIFEGYYVGSNTSSKYFLYDPITKKYFESGFYGTSLEFCEGKIYETNRCCAGTLETDSEYDVVENEMVLTKKQDYEMNDVGEMLLIEEHCYKMDKKTGKMVEVKCK